jgi:putative FmdB family regulatory protein
MPTYEYECEKCACRFEVKRRFSEDAGSTFCPQCSGKVRQLYSPAAILFKGSGFYITDSRNNLNQPSEEGKTDKVESNKKDDSKAEKVEGEKKIVEGGKKEERKADKVEGARKEVSKAEKAEGGKKEEVKADKAQSGKKEEGK